MDLHVYRNSQDRWYDLRSAARDRGAVLAVNAVTLDELAERLTPDVKTATPGQRLALVDAVRPPPQLRRGGAKRRGGAGQQIDFLDQHHPSQILYSSPSSAAPIAFAPPSSAQEGSLISEFPNFLRYSYAAISELKGARDRKST